MVKLYLVCMNFLAHIYLSGNDDFVKIGNFMADGVRGNDYKTLHPGIQKGIIMHRHIDTFTDSHPIFRKSKHRLHENFGHYSGIITDVFYDHFLAKNWSDYSSTSLNLFANDFYTLLETHFELLTLKTQQLLPYMKDQNWLLSYEETEGIRKILHQMDQRMKRNSQMSNAVNQLNQEYELFKEEFISFFEEIRHYVTTLEL